MELCESAVLDHRLKLTVRSGKGSWS